MSRRTSRSCIDLENGGIGFVSVKVANMPAAPGWATRCSELAAGKAQFTWVNTSSHGPSYMVLMPAGRVFLQPVGPAAYLRLSMTNKR